MYRYQTKGTCSVEIQFDIDSENKLRNVKFIGGCRGNTQGVAKLCEGRDADEVASILRGVQCRGGTSCPDQLSRAIEEYKNK